MLRLRCCRQPPTAGDALGIHQVLQDGFGDDEKVLDGREPAVLLGRRAVDVRPTGRVVLDDRGANFSGGSWCVAYHVEMACWAIDCSCVG